MKIVKPLYTTRYTPGYASGDSINIYIASTCTGPISETIKKR